MAQVVVAKPGVSGGDPGGVPLLVPLVAAQRPALRSGEQQRIGRGVGHGLEVNAQLPRNHLGQHQGAPAPLGLRDGEGLRAGLADLL